MKEIINRTITIDFELESLAKDFGYDLEVDEYESVHHEGYTNKYIRSQDLSLPENYEDLNKVLPSVVAKALEDAERSAWASYIREERVNAFKRCLEKINLDGGGADYVLDDWDVSAKAGILSVEIKDNNVIVEILNPEHLINCVMNGVGHFYPELSPVEEASVDEIKKRFSYLKKYFEVFGENKPEVNTSSQYSPSIDNEYLSELIKGELEQLELSTIADEAVDNHLSDEKMLLFIESVLKFTSFSKKEIVSAILERLEEDAKEKLELKNILTETFNEKLQVVLEIYKGVCTVEECPEGVEVIIDDLDCGEEIKMNTEGLIKVLVEVKDGIAEVIECPDNVEVTINDLDC